MNARWKRISCDEYEEHLALMGDAKRVYSGLTDLDGEFGTPIIETVWCRADAPDEPLLKGVRHPSVRAEGDVAPWPDRLPCEHYFIDDVRTQVHTNGDE
ncbi:MAG: hypothetical protein CMH34_05245 [Microbacterium sp.]|nr:hypothetical protein [Microbacterium sp.]|tara:strand:- start:80 stop:376 length:297 start_codon:yes stop_codon:yes gene_type:complete